MTIRISAFNWVPDFARGFVKDLRIRWALEEAGLPYERVLIDHEYKGSAEYRRWQPFGQVPAFDDGEVSLFELGAILLYLAERSPALAPNDPAGRARASSWVFAALNSIEPHAQYYLQSPEGSGELRAQLAGTLDGRLKALTTALGARACLEDRFTVGDIAMTTVLRELADDGFLASYATLSDYVARGVERPAFQRALTAQLGDFRPDA